MRGFKWTVYFICLSMLLCVWVQVAQGQQSSWRFSLLPQGGSISGQAGDTIGWGYNIENDSNSDWLFVSDVRSDTPFQHGAASNLVFNFPIIAPGAAVSVPYDGNIGLANFTWDANTPSGYVNSGNFIVSATWYDGDPFNGGNPIVNAGDQIAPYQVSVTGSTSIVPEPSSWWIGGLILLFFGAAFLRKPVRSSK